MDRLQRSSLFRHSIQHILKDSKHLFYESGNCTSQTQKLQTETVIELRVELMIREIGKH